MKNICLFLMILGISTHAWSAESSVAKFVSYPWSEIGSNYTDDCEDDDWYLSIGGGNDRAGFNKNCHRTIGDNFGTGANASHDGWYMKSKKALANVCKVTFTYTQCSTASECDNARMYLAYSTNGSTWSAVTLTSGTQGMNVGPNDDPSDGLNTAVYTFEFNKIASAYYAVIISRNGSVSSDQGFAFSHTTIDFIGGCCTDLAKPTGLAITQNVDGTHGKTTFAWNAVTNASGGYVLTVTKDGTQTITYDRTSSQLSKTGTLPAGNYTWSVSAVGNGDPYCVDNEAQEGPSFCVGADLTAATVSGFSATALTTTSARLTWTAVSGAEYYEVEVKEDGKVATVASDIIEGTTWDVTGLTANKTYRFYWKAVNICDDAYNSAVNSANTFSIVAHTVDFDLNGKGSGKPSDQIILHGGKATKPSNPTPPSGWSFGGWYKEAGCTNAWNFGSDVVNADQTLYAKWVERIYYQLDVATTAGVIIIATPSGSSAVSEGNYANVEAGTTVTVNYSNVETASGYSWYGWDVYKTGDTGTKVSLSSSTANNATFTMPDYPVTVSAKLFGDLRAFCEAEPEVTISGTIKVTSTNGKWVKAADVLQVSGTNLSTATITVASSSADVRLSKTGAKSSFAQSITIDVVNNEVVTTNIYVAYNPSETTDGINNTVVVTVKDNPSTPTAQASTTAGDIQCRHLPAKFVIATKIGGNWYALPNNITTESYGARDLSYPLIVDDADYPTTATIYTSTTDYLAWGLNVAGPSTDRFTTAGEKIAFVSAIGSKGLAGNASGLRNSAALPATTSDDYPGFTWTPSTTDLANYTLQNGSATSYYVATNGSDKWTTAATGANVRFLAYDAHVAPTITWQNDMLESQHAQNTAENGVVTLPTGANPQSCNEPSGLFTFDGWVTATWSGYKTTGFTKVSEGDAATSDATYYAVFKDANNRYYTQCPTIYSITYTPNGGTGSNYVVYTMNTTADAVTVGTAGFSKEGSTFVGWTNPDNAEGAIITPGAGKITGLSGDITLNAVWMGTTTITGTVRLTSAAGEEVATGTTDVTISNADFACATALRITYYDVTNNVTYGRAGNAYRNSEFRLCNASYNVADESNISLTEVTGAYNQTFSITYEPNGGANTLDHYQLKVEVLLKNTVIVTKTLDLYGRTLPASFAIAIKVGGSWYALPNNMASEGTYDPVLISVTEDANVLNWSAQGPSTVAYKMKDYTPNYSKLRFAANDANEYCLWASVGNSDGIRNYSASSTDNNYAWTVTETNADFSSYTMANLANSRTALKIYDGKWKMHNAGGLSEIHFIPFTPVTPIDVTVMEWGVNEIAVKTVASWNPSAITAQISGGSATTVTKTAIGGDLYKLTGVGDLKGNPGEPLALNITDGGAKQAIIQIPFIVAPVAPETSETKTEGDLAQMLVTAGYVGTLGDAREMTKNMDVIVRSGGTLSSSSSKSGKFNNVYIYPGGKADISKDISIQNIYMRGGFSWLGGAYAHPQLLVASDASISGIGSTNHGIFYDIYLDNAIYYMFALPKTVAVTAITNEENGDDWDAWIKSYSGQGRTLTPKVTGWSYVTSGSIERGKGYEIAIKPRLNRPYGILRFPLLKSTAWSAEGDCSPEVKGWGANNTSVADNNKGWNIIGNPFLTAYNNTAVPGSDPSGIIQTKTLVEHKVNDKWDGTYEWSTKNVKYFTIPRFTEYEYDDVRAISSESPVKLEPFFPFFIQVTGDGSVSFNASNRVLKMQSLYTEETPREVMVDFALTNSNGVKDVAGLTISDQYSADFDMEDKEKTIQNGNASMKVYTMVGEYRTAFNSLPEAVAAQPIPVGYIAPQAGKYDFSLVDGDYSEVEHVWLTDYSESAVVDLLLGDKYEFETEAGAFNERFALNVILKSKEDPIGTGIDAADADYDVPIKFIYQDKMYIRYRGVIYDATGKKVSEIK